MEYSGRCLKHAYAISIVVLVHISASLSLFHHHANATRCVDREREALLAVKQDLVDEYDRLTSWGSGSEAQKQDCCRWEGVYCDNQTGLVLRLHLGADLSQDQDGKLYYPALRGKISPKLIELHHLTYLDLSNNDFNGSQIPPFIGSLTNLRYLDLNNARFGGQIPYHQLGNLTHLQHLDLGFNDLFHSVENLNWLPHLSSLKHLDLGSTNLSNVFDWLETVNKLPNLRNLSLSFCHLPPPIFSTISHINSSKSLALVDLRGNNVTSSIFKWLCRYNTTLVHLDLSSSRFGGQIPFHALGNLTNLQYLYLGFTHSVENLNWLPHLSSLKYLDLSFTNLSNVFNWLEIVNRLPNLRNLSLSYCDLPPPILSSSFSYINSSKSLALVDLGGNNVTSSIFKWLCNYNTTLVYLDLSVNKLSGSLPDVFGNMSSLAHLDLSSNQLEGGIPGSFAKLSGLQHLDISWNNLKGEIPDSFAKLCGLQYLYIGPNNLSGHISNFFESSCAQNSLETLNVCFNNLEGPFPDLTKFLALKTLELFGNQLSGTIPESIGQLSKLETFRVEMNHLDGVISEAHFSQLSKLQTLHLSFNSLAVDFHPEWVPPFQLDNLSLGKMGPLFPKWLRTQKNLQSLYISDAGISDIIPSWFWDWSQNISLMDLSRNEIKGTLLADSGFQLAYEPARAEFELESIGRSHPFIPFKSFIS